MAKKAETAKNEEGTKAPMSIEESLAIYEEARSKLETAYISKSSKIPRSDKTMDDHKAHTTALEEYRQAAQPLWLAHLERTGQAAPVEAVNESPVIVSDDPINLGDIEEGDGAGDVEEGDGDEKKGDAEEGADSDIDPDALEDDDQTA